MTLNWLNCFAELGSATPLGGVRSSVATLDTTQHSIDSQLIYFSRYMFPFCIIFIVNYIEPDPFRTIYNLAPNDSPFIYFHYFSVQNATIFCENIYTGIKFVI